jgi:hypothetical protein
MTLGCGTRLDTSQRGAALIEELVDSTPLSAQCEKPLLLVVAGVWLALRRAREGWDQLRLVPASSLAVRLADLHDLAAQPQVVRLALRMWLSASTCEQMPWLLKPLQPTQSS